LRVARKDAPGGAVAFVIARTLRYLVHVDKAVS
jgi:hypothetical protein